MHTSVLLQSRTLMPTTMTIKGQVTIPKHIRDALHLTPGVQVEFLVNEAGHVVLVPGQPSLASEDRFEAVRGRADIKYRTDELMALLRGEA